jgi:methanogenic corrinoid protein MtbC1
MRESDQPGAERIPIGEVVEVLSAEYPDITHSSLRFLEREGLIMPDRTAGGHRLFPREQVERIRTIKSWQRQRLSLEDIRQRLHSADQLRDVTALATEFLNLLLSGEREAAQRLILDADDVGIPLVRLFDDILRPALLETGELWERGIITVGQEKEISAFCRDLIALLGSRHRMESPADPTALVAACVEGEYHELGLRMITAILRERGYLVHYLGPSVDARFLVERVTARRPAAVLLTAVQAERRVALISTLEALQQIDIPGYTPEILVGGAGVPPASDMPDHLRFTVVDAPDFETVTDQLVAIVNARGNPKRLR